MKKFITILFVFASLVSFGQAKHKEKFGVYKWMDSVYFNNVPYNSTAAAVHLAIDTNMASPTYGKLVRKTAGGSTPTLQQVLDAGSTLSSNETITVGANTLDISGTGEAFKVNTTTVGNAFQVTNSGAGGGIFSVTQAGKHYTGQSTYTSTNAVEESFRSNMFSSGTTANGFGQTWIMNLENGSGTSVFANGIYSKYRDVTAANRTTQIGMTGVIRGVSDTLMALGDYVTLTESTATVFTTTPITTGAIRGGAILITVEANDATDYQSRTLRFIWSAVNKAGTITVTISTPEEVVAVSSGTLTVTITAVDAGSGVLQFKADATSSLTQSTLRATYQTFKNF